MSSPTTSLTFSELAQEPHEVQAVAARMNAAQRELLSVVTTLDKVRALVRSDATFDVGLWFRYRRVWVAGLEDRLAVFADGPRPYLQVLYYGNLFHSFFDGMSGELVLLPAPELAVRILPMNPAAGQVFLSLIKPRKTTGADTIFRAGPTLEVPVPPISQSPGSTGPDLTSGSTQTPALA